MSERDEALAARGAENRLLGRQIDSLRAALRRYGVHDDGWERGEKCCASAEDKPCDCGLDAALKGEP